jgi:hypothetical protein
MCSLLFLKASALFFTCTLFPDWQNNAWETRYDTFALGFPLWKKMSVLPLVFGQAGFNTLFLRLGLCILEVVNLVRLLI